MQHISRILLALTVLLSGVALIPFVDVPAETFEWQRYAGVYEEPDLMVNYLDGLPGSYFRFTGSGFSPSSSVTVFANDNILGTTTTDNAGNLDFSIGSDGASLGNYYITVTEGNASLTERITLSASAPLQPLEGDGDLFALPAGIALTEVYLPLIVK